VPAHTPNAALVDFETRGEAPGMRLNIFKIRPDRVKPLMTEKGLTSIKELDLDGWSGDLLFPSPPTRTHPFLTRTCSAWPWPMRGQHQGMPDEQEED